MQSLPVPCRGKGACELTRSGDKWELTQRWLGGRSDGQVKNIAGGADFNILLESATWTEEQ